MKKNRLYLGDTYKLIYLMKEDSVDLVVMDPPYDICAGGGGGAFGVQKRDYHNDVSKNEDINSGISDEILEQLEKVMKKTNIYIFCNKNQLRQYFNFYKDKNIDLLVWHKLNAIPTINNKYMSDLEYIFFAREKGTPMFNTYERSSKLFQSPTNKKDKELFEHPTIKPLNLIRNFILNSSEKDDVVFDPFIGSGTTAVACKETGRFFIGFEKNPKYFKIANNRINGITANGQTSIFTDFEKGE